MSRVLVIEPNLMLRYALAMVLTPDHTTQFGDGMPDSAALRDVDAIIVDASMLRQAKYPTPLDFNAIEAWPAPTLWIDDQELPSPRRVNWVQLKPPAQREQLLRSLFECINPPGAPQPLAKRSEASASKPAKPRVKKSKETVAPTADATKVIELIELVEVVDEEPGDD